MLTSSCEVNIEPLETDVSHTVVQEIPAGGHILRLFWDIRRADRGARRMPTTTKTRPTVALPRNGREVAAGDGLVTEQFTRRRVGLGRAHRWSAVSGYWSLSPKPASRFSASSALMAVSRGPALPIRMLIHSGPSQWTHHHLPDRLPSLTRENVTPGLEEDRAVLPLKVETRVRIPLGLPTKYQFVCPERRVMVT